MPMTTEGSFILFSENIDENINIYGRVRLVDFIRHSTELAFAIFTQLSQVQISVLT